MTLPEHVTQDQRIADLEDTAYLKKRVTELEATVQILLKFVSDRYPGQSGILKRRIKNKEKSFEGSNVTHEKYEEMIINNDLRDCKAAKVCFVDPIVAQAKSNTSFSRDKPVIPTSIGR